MFEGIRRTLSQRQGVSEKGKLQRLERERRLSFNRTRQLRGLASAEDDLKAQAATELSARKATTQAHRDRKSMIRSLRRAHGPNLGIRVAQTAKSVLYTVPVKSLRTATKLGKRLSLNRIVIGDTRALLGPTRTVRGRVMPTATPKSAGIFDINTDILK